MRRQGASAFVLVASAAVLVLLQGAAAFLSPLSPSSSVSYGRAPAAAAAARRSSACQATTTSSGGGSSNDDASSSSPPRPPIVAVIGHPGSGQTTFASMLAEEHGARLMGVAEPGILEELRRRIMEGKGQVSMPQAMTDAVAGRIAQAARGEAEGGEPTTVPSAIVLDGWPRGPYQLERLQAAGGDVDAALFLDTGEEKEDPQLTQLREALGPSKASVVVNEGEIKEVYTQVRAALAPALASSSSSAPASAAVTARKPAAGAPPAAAAAARESQEDKEETEEAKPLKFGGLILTGTVAGALRRAGIEAPTEVQEVALPRIRRGDDVLIHEETGSGKTLAYLLPLLQDLDLSVPRQVMVVTPTRELAVQVGRVANELLSSSSSSSSSKGSSSSSSRVALLIEESRGGGNDNDSNNAPPPLDKVAAPVVVGTGKVIWAEMAKCNGTTTTSSGMGKNRRPLPSQSQSQSQPQPQAPAAAAGGKRLRVALANLKALVVDEVDRCVAPLSVYATIKEKRQKARHPKPATLIIEEIYQKQRQKQTTQRQLNGNGNDAALEPVQFVGASATIGRPLRRELARCMGVDPKFEGPVVLRADRAAAKAEDGGRAVGIPSGIQHRFVAVGEDDMQLKLMAARAYLLEKRPRQPLIFVPSDTPVSEVVGRLNRLLRGTGIEVAPLHEAMGFTRGRDDFMRKGGRPKKIDPEEEAGRKRGFDLLTMEDQVAQSLSAPSSSSSSSSSSPSPILVSSVDAARGLDFGGACDCVLILGRVKTPDDYQHVAGRTGRTRSGGGGGAIGVKRGGGQGKRQGRGVVVSFISEVDVGKLAGYESMLGIAFEEEEGLGIVD